jgi:hypothetical protein
MEHIMKEKFGAGYLLPLRRKYLIVYAVIAK